MYVVHTKNLVDTKEQSMFGVHTQKHLVLLPATASLAISELADSLKRIAPDHCYCKYNLLIST